MPRPIHLLIKPASGNCNLRCTYCFYADITEKRETPSFGMMSEETLEAVVRKALERAQGEVTFAFQGGEPTLSGLPFFRRFVELAGVSKSNSICEMPMLEYCIREDLKMKSPRMMAILDPVKLVIDNYPEDQTEMLDVPNNLENESLGSRQVPFGRELYIEREDFMEVPPRKYFRMFPGNEVRLMNAYFVTCTGCEKDEDGNVTVIHATYDPESKGGNSPDGRKVKGTIHWVAAKTAVRAECRLYENLIDEEKGVYNEDGSLNLNPNSLTVKKECCLEPAFAGAKPYDRFQFVRNGYFCVDAKDSRGDALVFNRIVSLKSSFKLPKQNP